MQQWECIVCGWVYDEKIGDPDGGIAPGTKFEDIPDDWLCPECGVGKDDFELVEIADSDTRETSIEALQDGTSIAYTEQGPIVILGAGLAGYGLLKEFRKLNQSTPVTLICSDSGTSYSKPALSTGYSKSTSADDLAQASAAEMAVKYRANILAHSRVNSVDTAQKIITLEGDRGLIHYEKLVLALGADCIAAPLKGDALDHVFTVNDLEDFRTFQDSVSHHKAQRVCILGAGLIGCEYANDLLNGGFQTISIDPMQTCLPSLLPEPAGKAVEHGLRTKGADFKFGRTATSVDFKQDGQGLAITLDDGTCIEADLVLSAIGVRPRTELANNAGLSTNRGIKVNRELQTSDPNVYALGDCAEVDGLVLVYVAPLIAATRALAQTLNGHVSNVVYPAMPVVIKTPDCPVVVCPPPQAAEGEWQITHQDGLDISAEFENAQGEILGFALTGEHVNKRTELLEQVAPWLI